MPPSDGHGQPANQHQKKSVKGFTSSGSKTGNGHLEYIPNDDGCENPFENQL
jgi:hypothetical protein